MLVIGLDVGTTAAKGCLFETGAGVRHSAVIEYPLLHPRPGWEVQDPRAIWEAVRGVLASCVSVAGGAEVSVISLSSAMHGLLGLDDDLQPLTDLITWADARAAGQATALRGTEQGQRLHRTSGTPVHSMSPLTKLAWLRENDPDLLGRARWWVGLKDLIIARLTGRVATELSCASGTGMLDITTCDWNSEAIEFAGVRADQLPEVLPTTTAIPLADEVASSIGLPAGTPVVVGAGDGPLGNLGVGALTPGIVGLSLGTSGALRMVTDSPGVDEHGRLFCYALTESQWVRGGAVSNGGQVVRWAGQIFGGGLTIEGGSLDEALLGLASAVPAGSNGLVMLPYLMAERAPLWDPDIPGAYLGLRHSHTRGHLVRAAVEGVALQLSTILDELAATAPVRQVRATGGVFRSGLWREILAGTLGVPLVVTGGAEGTALGASALGLVGIEAAAGVDEALASLVPAGQDEEPTVASAELIETYRATRRRVPELIRQYTPVAGLFG